MHSPTRVPPQGQAFAECNAIEALREHARPIIQLVNKDYRENLFSSTFNLLGHLSTPSFPF